MSEIGYPHLGEDYSGFLHRHPATQKFPEMKKHVVVDLDQWIKARQFFKEKKLNSSLPPNNTESTKFLCGTCDHEIRRSCIHFKAGIVAVCCPGYVERGETSHIS